MLRTSTVLLKPTLEEEHELNALADASSALWNMANYERRRAFFTRNKQPTYASQCKLFKSTEPFKTLGTCKSQALLQKLNESWKAFWALLRLRKQGRLPPHIKKISPPSYWKKDGKRIIRSLYVRNDGWRIDSEQITISNRLAIPYDSGRMWVGKQGRLEITKDSLNGRWYAHIPVEAETPPCRTSSKWASLDLGICNLTTLYIEGDQPVIYSGRAVLSDWIYRTKRIADRQRKLPKHKHTSRSINIAYRKRTRRLKHSINAMLRDVFERLEANDVGHLAVGDLNGIREGANHGDSGNQKIHGFWAFNLILTRIYELGEEYGINVTKVSERDTSKTCCLCGSMHNGRIKRGLMVCKQTHQAINADVNGAVNIMKVAVDRPLSSVLSTLSKGASGSGLMAQPLLLRWNYNEWL